VGLIKDSVFYLHPAGGVKLKAKDVEWDDKGKYGAQIVVSFESEELLPEDSGKGDEPYHLKDWFNLSFTEKSRLKMLLKAYGAPVDSPEFQAELKAIEDPKELLEFVGDIVVGKWVEAMIVHKKGADGAEKHNVESYAPVRVRRKRSEEPTEEPAPAPTEAPKSRREAEAAEERPSRRSKPADDFEDDDD
jgi:hypothetical protein